MKRDGTRNAGALGWRQRWNDVMEGAGPLRGWEGPRGPACCLRSAVCADRQQVH